MPTSTISNVRSGAADFRVTATLKPGVGFKISDSSELERVVETTANGSGAWSLALERQSNITPTGSFWLIEEHVDSDEGGHTLVPISVGASNATLLASMIDPVAATGLANYLTQDAADARYLAGGVAFGWVDVKRDAGATADGIDNDTDPVIDAINLAGVGGTLLFPEGTYSVDPYIEDTTAGLSPLDGQTWIFLGEATLKARPVAVMPHGPRIINIMDVADVTIIGATIDGNDGAVGWAVGTVLGFSVRSSTDIKLIDCVAHNISNGDGFYLGDSGSTDQCERVDLVRCRSYSNGRQGISVVHAHECTLGDCHSYSNASLGFDIEPGAGEALSDIVIDGCHASLNPDAGFAIVGSVDIDGVQLANCRAYGNGKGYDTSVGTNISFANCWAYDNDEEGFYNSSILVGRFSECVSHNNTYGFRLDNSCEDCHLDECDAYSNSSGGFLVSSGTSDSELNNCRAWSNTGVGMYVLGVDNVVNGGQTRGNTLQGVRVDTGTRCRVKNHKAIGNSQAADDTHANILVSSTSADCEVSNCSAHKGTGATRAKYGIQIAGGANTTDTLVINNDLKNGGQTGAYTDAGTTTLVNLDGSANNWNRLV